MSLNLTLSGAEVLRPDGFDDTPLYLRDGVIASDGDGRGVDLSGYLVLPGIVDPHGDGFERHLAPRRGAMKQMNEGLIATESELAANGLTTAMLAQFVSWEGGLRGPDFARQVFQAIAETRDAVVTDIHGQLRLEVNLLDEYDSVPEITQKWGVGYVVFNDHLPHDRLAAGKRPRGLTGQALKAGRNPEKHLAFLRALYDQRDAIPTALDQLVPALQAQGVRLGSHDDQTAEHRTAWRARGVGISEFPETLAAAEAANAAGDAVVLGAPNVVRGGSHKGNASALDLIALGLCDALASDYHYPSLRRAALMVARSGLMDFAGAWALVSSGPARVLGFDDRGHLVPGLRADLVILDTNDHRVAATLSGGRLSYLSGDIAVRFFG